MKQEPLENAIGPDLAALLYRGVTKQELHIALGEQLGEDPDSAAVDVARMNTVGNARSWGYIVTGGRMGRNDLYKVVGWEAKPEYKGSDQWEGEEAELLHWVMGHPQISDWDEVGLQLSQGSKAPFHPRCPEFIRCYELPKGNIGYDFGDFLVLQKFISMPRFRIFNLRAPMWRVYEVALDLAKISLGDIQIRGIDLDECNELKSYDPRGWINKRPEAVYDVQAIVEDPSRFLNKRAMTTLRKLERETKYFEWDPTIDAETNRQAIQVIDTWRNTNERKMRQLAITRDYKSVDGTHASTFNFIGYRGEGHPVCINILDRLPANPEYVGLITEKSLNYRHMPGGHYGMSDYNIVMACRLMYEHGVRYFNAGGYDGGGYGLADHKSIWSSPELDVNTLTFTLSAPHLDKEKYRVCTS